MLTIDPANIEVPKLHHYLLGSVGPRPICFASTISTDGVNNLAPFSFFNVFSANPPIAIFSPARSGRTGQNKDTFHNARDTGEVVINVVNHNIAHQMSLASSPYAPDVDEFVKAGLTPIDSEVVKPKRIKESPVQMECKVNNIVELGENGGAGNLIICQIVRIHIDESVLDNNKMIDQQKIDLVARMGGNWYCRAHGDSMFEIPKPITTKGAGVDALPGWMSNHFSGNELGQLGSIEEIPSGVEKEVSSEAISEAKTLLARHKMDEAWNVMVGE